QFAQGPFALLSLFAAGPTELRRFAAGADIQTDDRLALEFSGPRAVADRTAHENAATLRRLSDESAAPDAIRRAREDATPVDWRNRGAMLLAADDYANAFEDFRRSVSAESTDAAALDGLVRSAVAAHRADAALALLDASARAHPGTTALLIAKSKL